MRWRSLFDPTIGNATFPKPYARLRSRKGLAKRHGESASQMRPQSARPEKLQREKRSSESRQAAGRT